MFDIRVFLVAALVASPAALLAAQGQLTLDEAMTRLLVVMVGATLAWLLMRTLWPMLAGPIAGATGAGTDGAADEPAGLSAVETPPYDDPMADLYGDPLAMADLGELTPLPE